MTELASLSRCFVGIIPSIIATCGREGEPNVTYLSQVHYVDPTHVALSCQFFNKTKRNVEENPYAAILFNDPVTMEAWRMRVRFVRAESSGPLFDTMSARIEVIASHTGMAGVFRLLSADVYEVLCVDKIAGFLMPPDPVLDVAPPSEEPPGPLTELRGLQVVSNRIACSRSLAELLAAALAALDELLGFSHSMVLLLEERGEHLVTAASRGYPATGEGARIRVGEGLVGTVAESRRMIRMSGMGAGLRYGRAVRNRIQAGQSGGTLSPELPLPGLCDAEAQLALPLLAADRLVGVLAVESRDPLCFDDWDEAFLQIVANQIAVGIEAKRGGAQSPATDGSPAERRVRRFSFYRRDETVFLDDEYLVRNVPGRILWRLLEIHARDGRTCFTNRELRLDPEVGLPRVKKDNLESRLILLRKRLEERCPEVRLVPEGRGRFALELDCDVELTERDAT